MSDIQQSLQKCREITGRAKSSFYPSFQLLPKEKEEAMEVLYAFMRYTDDLVDAVPQAAPAEKHAALDSWESAVFHSLENSVSISELKTNFPGIDGVEILPALKFIVEKYSIPTQVFGEVLDGVRSDIEPINFEEFQDCADYCHQVATSVGFASLAIWGTSDAIFSAEIVKAAKACGIAVQMTNIIRDLNEDLNNARVYLPLSDLKSAGITGKQILDLCEYQKSGKKAKKPKNATERFADEMFQNQRDSFYFKFDNLMEKELGRVETYYFVAAELYGKIHKDSRRAFGMIWDSYFRIFKKIRKNPRVVLKRRVRLSFVEKLRLFLRWSFLPPKRLR
ncbi:MAG: phytoene/squalene synthase family protein [Thermoguttaceae bacterium]